VKSSVKMIVDGKLNANQTLKRVGLYAKGRVQQSILKGNWAKNSDATLKNKTSTKPLVDTGTLLKAIDYEVID